MIVADSRPAALPPPATLRLFGTGVLIFVLTIIIGILNGTDLVDFDRNTILTHVHAGTLGWLTTAIVGAAVWLFGRPDDDATPLSWATIGVVLVYVAAFWTGHDVFRPMAGTAMFVVVVWVLVWVGARAAGSTRSVPHFAMLLSLVTLGVGAVMGILLGLAVTGRADWVPDGVAESHPPTMVIGYLVLAALGLAEWRLTGSQAADAAAAVADGRSPRLGLAQVILVFLAGVMLILGIMLDSEPLLIANAPLEIIGIGIFLKRLWGPLREIDWMGGTSDRLLGAATFFLVANTVLLVYLVGSSGGDVDKINMSHILALDHMMFVGVLTNTLFALIRGATGGDHEVGDDIGFFGINVGLAVFVVGLLAEATILKRIGTPILGLALLHAIATVTMRLRAMQSAPVG